MSPIKKNFKNNNPALNYITEPQEQEVNQEQAKPLHSLKQNLPKGYKINYDYIEAKSKRVQLLLQPSIAEAIKTLAKEKSLSVNETITEAIIDYLEKNK